MGQHTPHELGGQTNAVRSSSVFFPFPGLTQKEEVPTVLMLLMLPKQGSPGPSQIPFGRIRWLFSETT